MAGKGHELPRSTINFVGYVGAAAWESYPDVTVDLGYVRDMTVFHEQLGYDQVLIGYGPDSADSLQIAGYAAGHSERIRFLVAHRPGIVHPTLAARMFATLDHLCGGRLDINLVCGGTSADDPRREGDYLSKDLRYARAGEYVAVLKQAWTGPSAFSHRGTYYRFDDYPAIVRPLQKPWIPLYLAGSSPAARQVAAEQADYYAFYGEPLAGTRELIDSVSGQAARAGRTTSPRFLLRLSVILADTDDAAWERAGAYLERSGGVAIEPNAAVSFAEERIRIAAVAGQRHDQAMWTVRARGWTSSFNGLVGSPPTVASALLDYVRLGVTGFRINVLDYLKDTEAFARQVIPLVRAQEPPG